MWGLTIVALLFAAACGSDDSADSDAAPTSTAMPATQPSSIDESSVAPTTLEAEPTPEPVSLTVEQLGALISTSLPNSSLAAVGEDHPEWTCEAGPVRIGDEDHNPITDGPLPAGSVATCRPTPTPIEGEHPVLTVLVLDNNSTVAVAESGLTHPLLFPTLPFAAGYEEEVSSGLNCTELLAAGSVFSRQTQDLTPAQTYFGVVLYWFLEGRPSPLMDIDQNGVPCETLFSPEIVDSVWTEGWLP